MEKLKSIMTKLGIFKLMDKIDQKIKQGKNWVEEKKQKGKEWLDEKKENVKEKAKSALNKIKGFLSGKKEKYIDDNGETHTLRFKDTTLYRESVSKTLGNYLGEVKNEINGITNDTEKKKHLKTVQSAYTVHQKIVDLIGSTVNKSGDKYTGADKGFSPSEGVKLQGFLKEIADLLRSLPLSNKKKIIPETIINYKPGADGVSAEAPLISLDSKYSGSQPAVTSVLTQQIIDIVNTKSNEHRLVRGHLINHELFGTGEKVENLAPIPKKANSAMLNRFETEAKTQVHSNNVVSLKVDIIYGNPNDKKKNGKSLLKDKLPADTKIPVSISYDLNRLEFDGASNVKKEKINNPKNWLKKEKLGKEPHEIPISHDDFF
jgi:hypothetical protein